MKCTEDGIGVNRHELKALLGFCGKGSDEDKAHLAMVQFMVEDDRCWAYSTDGHRALEGDGESDTKHTRGEWLVVREFLDSGLKLLTNDERILRLQFSGASLTQSRIEDEIGMEVMNLGWPRDAVPAQQVFPGVRQIMKIPKAKKGVTVLTLMAEYLKDLSLVAAAAKTAGIECYAPEGPDKPSHFRCSGDRSTVWTAAIMPMRSSAAEPEEDEEKDEPQQSIEGAKRRKS